VEKDTLKSLIDTADNIIYDAPPEWQVEDPQQGSEQWWTEMLLSNARLYKGSQIESVVHIPIERYWQLISEEETRVLLELKDQRRTQERQLWFAGCSFTYGVGLADPEQRYGNILSDRLNMPASFLAWPASNIPWAADQILRSDIRKGDIVIWGVTQWTRVTHYDRKKNQLAHVHPGYYEWFPRIQDEVPPDMLDHPSRLYESLRAIHAVVNFCDKVGAKLILAGVLNGQDMGEYLANHYINYIYFSTSNGHDYYPDHAPNDIHPGPITHQMYADGIMEKMRELGYI